MSVKRRSKYPQEIHIREERRSKNVDYEFYVCWRSTFLREEPGDFGRFNLRENECWRRQCRLDWWHSLARHTFGSPGKSAKLIRRKNVDFSSQEALQIKKVLNTDLLLNMLETICNLRIWEKTHWNILRTLKNLANFEYIFMPKQGKNLKPRKTLDFDIKFTTNKTQDKWPLLSCAQKRKENLTLLVLSNMSSQWPGNGHFILVLIKDIFQLQNVSPSS